MKNSILFFILLILIPVFYACSLNSSQEKSLNKHFGLYIQSLRNKSTLVQVSMTHPAFVKYIKSKGNHYFKTNFSSNPKEEYPEFFYPKIEKIEFDKNNIHVLYEVQKDYIYYGENKIDSLKIVAISENDGKNWYFVNYSLYSNKDICKNVPRLLK